jgi:hypothetical protein
MGGEMTIKRREFLQMAPALPAPTFGARPRSFSAPFAYHQRRHTGYVQNFVSKR